MGFFNRLFGGGETDSERAIREAQAREARETAAIRGRIERGEVDQQDAMWQAADKGVGSEMKMEAAARRGEDIEAAKAAAEVAQDEAAA